MLTRKHFVEVARSIHNQVGLAQITHGEESQTAQAVRTCLRDVAEELANVFQADNPKFRRTQFLQACGLID